MQPPVYRAAAVFAAGLNFDRDPPLRQREQDLAEGKIAGFMRSENVLEEVEKALLETDFMSEAGSIEGKLRIERRLADWYFIVYDRDPARAAFIANTWAEAAQKAYLEARRHALRANMLEAQIERLQIRLLDLYQKNPGSSAIVREIESLERRKGELQEALETELELSHGVESFFSFEWTVRATATGEPVIFGRGRLIVGGAMAGMGMAVAALMIIPGRKPALRDRDGKIRGSGEPS
jgi:hypothetical protein